MTGSSFSDSVPSLRGPLNDLRPTLDGTPSPFFPYNFDRGIPATGRVIGLRSDRDGVRLDDERVRATFGFLNTTFDIAEISSVRLTGPHPGRRPLGPRLSLADRGLVFATANHEALCIDFHSPIDPVLGRRGHPWLTLTVAEPRSLARLLSSHLNQALS